MHKVALHRGARGGEPSEESDLGVALRREEGVKRVHRPALVVHIWAVVDASDGEPAHLSAVYKGGREAGGEDVGVEGEVVVSVDRAEGDVVAAVNRRERGRQHPVAWRGRGWRRERHTKSNQRKQPVDLVHQELSVGLSHQWRPHVAATSGAADTAWHCRPGVRFAHEVD